MTTLYILLGIFAVAIFFYFYVYKTYLVSDTKKFIPNNEFKSDTKKTATVTLYYTEWCPHCKTTRTDWDLFKTNYSSDMYDIAFAEVDCDKNPELSSEINEYPTIILTRGDNKYFYDSKFSDETMNKFINTTMTFSPE
jgi:glutaredoxin